MTALFVHGVPETTAIWDGLLAHVEREDTATLGLPGFGSPTPDFEPTMYNYADWLAAELAKFDEVDLVAHDWGALLSLRVLADRPANVRSWVLDVGNLADDFEWHDIAKLWISPDGEGFMEGMLAASAADRGAVLASSGIPAEGAQVMADNFDATMAACILALYRSSLGLGTEWGPGIDSIGGKGLVIDATEDPFLAHGRSEALAERTGAQVFRLEGAGHWWMLDSPAAGAEMLAEFWG